MVSWVVSNCVDDPSGRMQLVQSLNKTIPVDIYGKCGKPCENNCKGELAKEYYFYFAGENSLALDYISEKPFVVLQGQVIPVVYGGADYAKFLPPKSFINAQDFNTTEELGLFLMELSRDTEEYLSYFWWTEEYYVLHGRAYAGLCESIKSWKRNIWTKMQYYSDLKEWEHHGTWLNRSIEFS